MNFIDGSTLQRVLAPSSLIPHLLSSIPLHFPTITSPHRQIHPINPSTSSSLLLMPSFSTSQSLPYIGVKIVTSFPENPSSSHHLPSISASYLLFNSSTGSPLASIDGTQLTLLRTSSLSALASRFLSRQDSRILIIIGAGSLAPHLIRAHLFVRPTIHKVLIWNRSPSKARDLVARLAEEGKGGDVVFDHVEVLDDVIGMGDVVCCATGSKDPIVRGGRLKPGAHLNLVGSFREGMRECDDEALVRGRIWVDFETAMTEAGELVGALERGAIAPEDVVGTIVDLVGGVRVGRRSGEEITVFKTVGSAVVDLLAAQLAYETLITGD